MTIMQKPPIAARRFVALSHAQRGVWLDARLIADPTAYQVGCLVSFDSEIDPDLARQAVRMMIGRHDGLRLRIDRDEPQQWIEPAGKPPFNLIDLSAAEDGEAAVLEHVRAVQAAGFAFGEEPLFRVDLIRLAPSRWRLLMLAHHLIADGVSISLAQFYWLKAYKALVGETDMADDAEPAGEILPRSSYLPVVEDDEAYAGSSRYKDDMAYWRERLALLPELVFAGRPAPSEPGETLPVSPVLVDEAGLARFEAAARAAGTTLHRALLAVVAVAISRRYRRSDFTLGMALHRRDAATRHVVGMLAGMIAVRCRLDHDMSLQRAVTTLAAGFDADLRHQRLPIDALGRTLASDGAFSGRADRSLFDVAVTMMPAAGDLRPTIGGRPTHSTPLRTHEASPLALYVDEKPGRAGLSISCRFNPSVLTQPEVERFRDVLADTIEAFCAGGQLLLSQFDGLGAAERATLAGWASGTAMAIPQATLPDLFEAQAATTPDATAVIAEDGELSFAALDAAANRVAARLRASGVVTGDTVGICLPRSVAGIVALIGTLKAGGVYLPLDPVYPPERLAGMIADAGARVVVADASTEACLPPEPARLLADEAWPLSGELVAAPERSDITSGSRAYVIYTSGSTGRPKGVAVSHRALVNLAFARREHDPIGPGDHVLAAISIGFDVSLGQLLTPLLAGAAVVVAGDLRGVSAASFWDFLVRHRVSHVNSVPSFFETVLDAAPVTTSLKQIMLGGEPLSGALAARLRRRLGVPVYNMYGPTEACIDATAFRVPETGMEQATVLPIGRPLPNYACHVVDAALRPVGIGAEGELCIGGAGLAEGYLGLPDAAAERFVERPGLGRIYRTGDRAVWREDGALAFLGRSDAQVKIRGFRVEPGEIEAVLRDHPAVAQAAVIARRDHHGELRLLGYAVPAGGTAEPDVAELRAFLTRSLPAHMVPAGLMLLPGLPLSPNGKLDEAALPEPEIARIAGVAPRTTTEKLLAVCFATLLGVAEVDTASHFFELGGHSLLATQLASRLRDALGIELPIRMLFEAPRIADLGERIDALLIGLGAGGAGIETLRPEPRPERLPLSFEQERLWFLHKLDPQSPAYNIPIALRLDGLLDLSALERAFGALVARHESLRTRFAESDGLPEQKVIASCVVPIRLEDLSANDHATILARAHKEARQPFDLTQDALIRVTLLRLSETSHIALVTMHHIVSDGWSVGILLRELSAHYRAATTGQDAAVPALPLHYADYALSQRRRLDEAEIARQIGFWTRELAGAPEALTLPLERPRPAIRSDAGSTREIALPPGLAASVASFARAHQATPFIVLSAAWAALLSRWSGQDDIVIGAPIANRAQAGTEGLIGFFVNTIALRAELSGCTGFGQLVDRLRTRALDAYAHAELPFERLVEAINPAREAGRHPLFQTMVAFQSAPAASPDFGGLTASPIALPESAAKFDLTLVVNESAAGYSAGITYATDLFGPQTIARMAEQFGLLLATAMAEPACPLARLPLTNATERSRLIEQSRPAGPILSPETIPALFERQVRLSPQAEAVAYGPVRLSFDEANRRANRLAHALIALGVAPGRPVGVVLGRSEALVVAALGIMKAGGVYMPIDPAHPAERIAGMLARTAPAAVLADAGTASLMAPVRPVLRLDDFDWNAGPDHDPGENDRLGPLVATDDAYIVHTSGSSGEPKGVAVSHAALANLAAARLAHDPIGAGDRVLATMSISFDVSIGQIVTPLLRGATIVMCGDVATMTGEAFWSLLDREAITHLNSGPAFIDAMLETPPPALALKRLMLGGEAFPTVLARKIRSGLPQTEIFNMYGPTETCIDATAHRFTGQETGASLPIGRPLPNYRVIVLDEAMQPVPVGIAGEIFIGGASVARGYCVRPEETAQRFLPDPFGVPGERLYRTGDLARLNMDGEIEFLGRADGQVKIRGFRIELDEIAAALRAHPAIRSAAATTMQRQGETRIVAYAVPESGQADAAIPGWREHLEARLPSYMVPAALVVVPVLPMTVNGKLDVKALPEPDFGQAGEREPTPPRDDLDQTLLGIWGSLLGSGALGIDDNFFRAGGHSLQALRLASACKAQLGIELPIAAIYAHQTIRALADSIRSGRALEARGPLVKLGDGEGRPVFCFHPVGGAAFGYLGLANALEGRRPVYGVQASGLEAGEPLAQTIDEMMESYLSAIRARQPVGPYSLMGHSYGGLCAFEITRRLEAMGETVDRLVLLDTSPWGQPWTMEAARYTAGLIVGLERARSATPNAPIDPAQEERVVAMVANNMRLSQSYAPMPVATPMIYLLAKRGDLPPDGRRELWQTMSAQPLDHPALDCDHFAVLNRDNIAKLAVLFA